MFIRPKIVSFLDKTFKIFILDGPFEETRTWNLKFMHVL